MPPPNKRRPQINAALGTQNINRRRPRIDAASTVRRLFEEKRYLQKGHFKPTMSEPDTNPFEPTESDVEDASPTLQLLDSDRDEDSDIEVE